MANTVPASLPTPDTGLLLAGNGISSATIDPLFRASNWAQAYQGSGTPRVCQTWPRRGNTTKDPTWSYSTAASALICRWRMPNTRGATSATVYFWGKSTGGGGTVELKSTTAADTTGAQALPAVSGLIGPFTLDIDASGGWEELTLWCDATGGEVFPEAVNIYIPPAASPLGTGVGVDGCTAFDVSEFGVDLPLGADSGRQMLANLAVLRAIPHVYWNWSGLADGSLGSDGKFMMDSPHLQICPVWVDTDNESWSLTVHAYAASDAGVDTYIRVHAMMPGGLPMRTLEMTVPAAAADAWYTGTLSLPLGTRALRTMPRDFPTVCIGVLPYPSIANIMGFLSRHTGLQETHMTTASVRAISVWGR